MKMRNILILISFISVITISGFQNQLNVKYENMGGNGMAYVCHINQDFVTVFDTKNNEPVGKIDCGKGSSTICFSPDGKFGYIANFMSNDVTVFDKRNNSIIATVTAGEHPQTVIPVQNGKYVFISHESNDGDWVLNTSDNTIFKKLDEGTGRLYLVDNQSKIYQPQIFTPFLFVIDPNTFAITKRVNTGGRPLDMAFINDKYGYIANYDLNELTKIDIKADSVVGHVKNTNHARGIAATSDGKLIFVTDVNDNKVNVVSAETDEVISSIDGFKMPVAITITSDNKFAYVVNQGSASISVVDTDSKQIIKTISVANNPISIYIDY